jgi:modulator of FtsH protease HflK
MPWQNNNGGGPWGGGPSGGGGGGGPRNPWGQGGGGGRGGGSQPPNIDDLLRKGQERLRQSLPGGGQTGSFWMLALAGLFVLWILSTSVYRVNADEVGVVQRFGAFERQTLPGLQFKLPAPIETVSKPRVTQVKMIDIPATEESVAENLVLTGDQNIVDISYTVRWKIRNREAAKFLFTLENPENTIREVAESAMREAISRTPLDAAIGQQRSRVAASVEERLQSVLDGYGAGIDIEGVFFKKVDPPEAVISAFKDVTSAQQDAQRFTNQANAYRQQIIAQAQGDAARFDAVYEQYRLAPEVTRKRLYLETMEQVLGGMNKIVVGNESGVVPYLPLPELSARRQPAPVQE